MKRDTPVGWSTATVGELAWRIQYGTSAKTGRNQQGIPVIRMGNIQDGKIVMDDVKTLPLDHPEFPGLLLDEGDVLFNRTNSPELVGKTAVFIGSKPTSFASYLIRISLKEGCLPKWLACYINSHHGREWVAAVVNQQVGQANVSGGKLRDLEVPVPPVNEQRRIVAKLEALLAKVDTSRKRLERLPIILKRFRQAVLAAACDGRLTEDWRRLHPDQVSEQEDPNAIEGPSQLPSTWNWASSSRLFEFVTSGSRGWAQYYSDSGPIFIRVGNLNHDSIVLDLTSIQHVSPPKGSEGMRTRIRVGDILVSITADVGMIALVQQDVGEAYINQHVALARPSGNIDSIFLAWFLASGSGGQRQFGDLQRGATKVGLGLDDIRAIWVAKPPRDEQKEIVRRISSLFSLADQIEARYTKAKAQVDRLSQSILAKAFRGELVPQDPNDEPADLLLSRLGAAPTVASAPARRRGRPPRVQPATPPTAPSARAEGREAPALVDLTPEAILTAHREVLASISHSLNEDNLLRAVALRLGFQRLGARVKTKLQSVLLSEVRDERTPR